MSERSPTFRLTSEHQLNKRVLRCERRIEHEDHPDPLPTQGIRARWLAAVNARLTLDVAMTHRRYGRKALPRSTVLNTWRGTLRGEENLPADWIGEPGLLVGMEPLE